MYKSAINLLILFLLTSCMQVKLKEKIDLGGNESNAPTPNDTYNEDNESRETQFIESRSMNIRYGDYKFLSSFLKEKFGPNCNSTINSNIYNNPGIFGGVCDGYDRSYSCNDLDLNNPLALGSTMRAGRIMKTCEEILENDKCLDYFLEKSGLDSSDILSDNNVSMAYKDFYPLTSKVKQDQLNAFSNLAGHFNSSSDKWKAITLSLCVSPGWQIP